jgi:hypothetical protein
LPRFRSKLAHQSRRQNVLPRIEEVLDAGLDATAGINCIRPDAPAGDGARVVDSVSIIVNQHRIRS